MYVHDCIVQRLHCLVIYSTEHIQSQMVIGDLLNHKTTQLLFLSMVDLIYTTLVLLCLYYCFVCLLLIGFY